MDDGAGIHFLNILTEQPFDVKYETVLQWITYEYLFFIESAPCFMLSSKVIWDHLFSA